MSNERMSAISAVALAIERRGTAAPKAARSGREGNLSSLIAFGAPGPQDGGKYKDAC